MASYCYKSQIIFKKFYHLIDILFFFSKFTRKIVYNMVILFCCKKVKV